MVTDSYLAELPVENVEIFFVGDGNKYVVIVVIRIRKVFRRSVGWNSDGQAEEHRQKHCSIGSKIVL